MLFELGNNYFIHAEKRNVLANQRWRPPPSYILEIALLVPGSMLIDFRLKVWLASLTVQTLFPLPAWWKPFLNFNSRTILILCHLAISYRSKVFFGSSLVADIFNPWSTTSDDISIVILMSVVVEIVGVAVGIMSVCRWKLELRLPEENL